jgi:hypothetical protein
MTWLRSKFYVLISRSKKHLSHEIEISRKMREKELEEHRKREEIL